MSCVAVQQFAVQFGFETVAEKFCHCHCLLFDAAARARRECFAVPDFSAKFRTGIREQKQVPGTELRSCRWGAMNCRRHLTCL